MWDWGQLGHFPFDPAVWGTASEWVGAGGTTVAALFAAWVYWRDRRANARIQARQVIFRAQSDKWDMRVRNYSDMPVFDLRLSWGIALHRSLPLKPWPVLLYLMLRLEVAATALDENVVHCDILEAGDEWFPANLDAQPKGIDFSFVPFMVLRDVRGKVWRVPALGEKGGRPRKFRPRRRRLYAGVAATLKKIVSRVRRDEWS